MEDDRASISNSEGSYEDNMSATLRRQAPRPPDGTKTNGSLRSNGSEEDSINSIPEFVDIDIVLPDGQQKHLTVEYGKHMMDLLVAVAASNKYSPAGHTFQVFDEETGRPLDYKASQSVGSLAYGMGITTFHMISKKSTPLNRKPQPMETFEKTQRLTINLPRNQKWLVRINPQTPLEQIFKMACTEKHLDPRVHDLRHPTRPEEVLNVSKPLQDYSLHDITVVHVPDGGKLSTSHISLDKIPAPDPYKSGTIAQQKPTSQPTTNNTPTDDTPSYMPGMTMDKKKKKGFMSLFNRKKEGKFNVGEATYGATANQQSSNSIHVTSTHVTPYQSSTNSRPVSVVQPQQTHVENHNVTTSQNNHASQANKAPQSVPQKPPRKKRPAPPPPPGASQPQGNLSVKVKDETVTHSRNSSHSSGFESSSSPLESPNTSNRDQVDSGGQTKGVNAAIRLAATNRHINAETSNNGAENAVKPAARKKRRAPAPPGAVKADDNPAATSSPKVDNKPTQDGANSSDEGVVQTQAEVSITESHDLNNSRPCLFVPPPPPDTPPPSTEEDKSDVSVSDSSTQVHVTMRDSLSSDPGQKSDVADFVDKMAVLTENVKQVEIPEEPSPETKTEVIVEHTDIETVTNTEIVNSDEIVRQDEAMNTNTVEVSVSSDTKTRQTSGAYRISGVDADDIEQEGHPVHHDVDIPGLDEPVVLVNSTPVASENVVTEIETRATVVEAKPKIDMDISVDSIDAGIDGEITFDQEEIQYVDPTTGNAEDKVYLEDQQCGLSFTDSSSILGQPSPVIQHREQVLQPNLAEDDSGMGENFIPPPSVDFEESPRVEYSRVSSFEQRVLTEDPTPTIVAEEFTYPKNTENDSAVYSSVSDSVFDTPKPSPIVSSTSEEPKPRFNSLREAYRRPSSSSRFNPEAIIAERQKSIDKDDVFAFPNTLNKAPTTSRVFLAKGIPPELKKRESPIIHEEKSDETPTSFEQPNQRLYVANDQIPKAEEQMTVVKEQIEMEQETPPTAITVNQYTIPDNLADVTTEENVVPPVVDIAPRVDTSVSSEVEVISMPVHTPPADTFIQSHAHSIHEQQRHQKHHEEQEEIKPETQKEPEAEIEPVQEPEKEPQTFIIQKPKSMFSHLPSHPSNAPNRQVHKPEPQPVKSLKSAGYQQYKSILKQEQPRSILKKGPRTESPVRVESEPVVQKPPSVTESRKTVEQKKPVSILKVVHDKTNAKPESKSEAPVSSRLKMLENSTRDPEPEPIESQVEEQESVTKTKKASSRYKVSEPMPFDQQLRGSVENVSIVDQVRPRKDFLDRERRHSALAFTAKPYKSSEPSAIRKVSGPKFWGAKPWQARNTSEPSASDVTKAIALHERKQTPSGHSGLYKDSSLTETSPTKGTAKEECSRIGFEPRIDDESDSRLEDKSLMFMNRSHGGVYGRGSITPTPESNKMYSTSNLTRSSSSESLNNTPVRLRKAGSIESLQNAARSAKAKRNDSLTEKESGKESAKQTLQLQYNDLQSQFSKWRDQLQTNQVILTQKKPVPSSSTSSESEPRESVEEDKPTPEKEISSFATRNSTVPPNYVPTSKRRNNAGSVLDRRNPSSPSHPSSRHSLFDPGNSSYLRKYTSDIGSRSMGRPSSMIEQTSTRTFPSISVSELTNGKHGLKRNSSLESTGSSTRYSFDSSRSSSLRREGSPSFASPVPSSASSERSLSPPVLPLSPPPPPPPPQSTVTTQQTSTRRKWGAPANPRPAPKSRFEPQLDPREELMIAIRNANGRNMLRKVDQS